MEWTCPDDGAGAPPRRTVGTERPEGGPAPRGPGLVRALGPIDATMIVIGSMIGSGIFITSAESSRLSGAPGWLLLAWAIAGLLTITGALCCSELATMMPRAGGVYVFLREAYGKPIGFLYGWTLFLVIQTGTIAAVAIAFAKFLGVFVAAISPENYLVVPISFGSYAVSLSSEQLVAIGLIVLLTWTNTRGLEVGKIVQNTFTFAKTAALAAVIVIGLSLGWSAGCAALHSAWWNSWVNGWSPQVAQPGFTIVGGLALALLFGKSMVGPLFAQTAWTNVTFIGSEVRDPGKNLMRALVAGCGIVVVLYLLANLEYIVSADLLFYLLMVVAVMILRRTKPEAERPYFTWGYPIVPVISILVAGLLVVDLGFLAPATSGIGILIVLTGVPAYFFWRKA